MTRQKLPHRRASELVTFIHENCTYEVSASRYEDGRLAEVFMDTAKPGQSLDIMAKDCATLLSIALQHGVPVDEIKAALSQEKTGEMRGPIGVALEMLERS